MDAASSIGKLHVPAPKNNLSPFVCRFCRFGSQKADDSASENTNTLETQSGKIKIIFYKHIDMI